MNQWSPGMTLEAIEREVIIEAFRFYQGNKTQTAISLGIAIRTLDAKLEKYGDDAARAKRALEDERIKSGATLARMRGITPATPCETRAPIGDGAAAGVRMESIANAPAQHAVSVSKQPEVQKLLPADAAKIGQKRRG